MIHGGVVMANNHVAFDAKFFRKDLSDSEHLKVGKAFPRRGRKESVIDLWGNIWPQSRQVFALPEKILLVAGQHGPAEDLTPRLGPVRFRPEQVVDDILGLSSADAADHEINRR